MTTPIRQNLLNEVRGVQPALGLRDKMKQEILGVTTIIPRIVPESERQGRLRSLVKERNDLINQDFWITDESKARINDIKREEATLLRDPGMSPSQYKSRMQDVQGIEQATPPWEIFMGLGAGKAFTQMGINTLRGALVKGAAFAAPITASDVGTEYALDKLDVQNPWARLGVHIGAGVSVLGILEALGERGILALVNKTSPNFFSKHLNDLVPAGTTNITDLDKARLQVLRGRIDKGDQLALDEAIGIITKARYGQEAEKARLTRIAGKTPEETVEARYARLRRRRFEDISDEDLQEINDLAKIKTTQSFDPEFERVKHNTNAKLAADAYVNHPVIDFAENVTQNGGFNESRMRLMWGDDNVDAIMAKYPGLITSNGTVDPIKKAVAWDKDVDQVRDFLLKMPDYEGIRRGVGRDLDYEWKLLYQDEIASRTGGTELQMWKDIGGDAIVKRIRKATREGEPRVSGDSILMRRMADETNFLRKVGSKVGAAYRGTGKADVRIQELARAAQARDAVRRKEGLVKVKGRMNNALKPSSAPEEFQQQLHNLLSPYMGKKAFVTEDAPDLRTFLDQKIAQGVPLAKLIREQYDDMIDLPQRIPKVDDLTVGEYKKFGALVNDLRRMGLKQRQIDTISEKQAIDDYIHTMTTKADQAYGRKFKKPSFREALAGKKMPVSERADRRHKWLAGYKRPEHIFREVDVWDDFGEAQKMFRNIKLAEDHNFQISKVLGERWQKILGDYADDLGLKRFKDTFWRERFYDSKSDISMTRENMITMAAMTGNRTNRAAVRRAMRRDDGVEMSDIAINRFLKENMTEADWKFVKEIWKMTDEMYNMLGKVYTKVTGRTLPKIEKYFPIVPNYKFTKKGYTEDIEDAYMSMPHFNRIPKHIKKDFFRERTDATDAIKMNLDALGKHFRDVAHTVSHWERTNDVRKVITNPKFKDMVSENLGEHKYGVLKNWIDDVIRPSGTDAPGWYKLRGRVTVAMLGAKLSTAAAQTLSLAPAIPRVGKKNLLEAGARFARNPMQTIKVIRELSEQMAARNHTWQREIGEMMKTGEASKIRKMGSVDKDIFFSFIRSVDTMTSSVVWYAGWLKGMQKYNGNQNRAIAYADQTIRLTQPQSALKDLPEKMRSGKEWDRLLTMFYSYYSVLHNQAAELIQRKKAGDASMGELISGLNYMYVIPALMRSGGIDRDLSLGTVGKNMATHIAGGLPIIRDAASVGAMGYDYQISPVGSQIAKALETTRGVFKKAGKVAEGEADMSSLLMPTVEAGVQVAPLFTTFPSSQIMTLIRGMEAAAEGEDVDFLDIAVKKRKQEEK